MFAAFTGLAARLRQQTADVEGSKIAAVGAIAFVLALMSSDTGKSMRCLRDVDAISF